MSVTSNRRNSATLAQATLSGAWLYVLIGALALLAYFAGLDGRYIPKNGDESVYVHITRHTAAVGQWLPLQSELDGMRNTKPPLLFWQGILSTNWMSNADLWNLRWPSVLYTFLVAAMVFALAARITGRVTGGLVGALAWLAFFSTYRYGRPFLTNPPEIFWLFLPFFAWIMLGRRVYDSRWLVPLLFGVAFGIGLLYKSFALALPLGVALLAWFGYERDFRIGRAFFADLGRITIMMATALGLFALWFVFDPDPAAVWQEFVIGENAQKFDAERGYLRTLLWSDSSIWSLALNYPLNAGLLMAPVAIMFVIAFRERRVIGHDETLLWIWVFVFFLVFALPSQRSGRYLMPAMPAMAVLLAVYWQRIPRWAFVLSLLTTLTVTLLFVYLSLQVNRALPENPPYGLLHGTVLIILLTVIGWGLWRAGARAAAAMAATFLVYLSFSSLAAPFERDAGRFDPQVQEKVRGTDVWVPCNFRASHEGHRFLLPGANVLGYDDGNNPAAGELATRYPQFVVRVPIGASTCAGCTVIGERLEIRSRHSQTQIDEMMAGRIFENLFVRELLVRSDTRVLPAVTTPESQSQCR